MKLSGGLYRLHSKSEHAKINIKIAKGFTKIAELEHKSILWIRLGDIYLGYTKPVTIKLKVFRQQ